MEVSYQAINRYSCTGAFSYVALQLPKFLNYAASFCQSAVNCKLDNIVSTFLINYQKFFENPRMSDGIDKESEGGSTVPWCWRKLAGDGEGKAEEAPGE